MKVVLKVVLIVMVAFMVYNARYEILDAVESNVITEQEVSVGPVNLGKVRMNLKGEVVGYDF